MQGSLHLLSIILSPSLHPQVPASHRGARSDPDTQSPALFDNAAGKAMSHIRNEILAKLEYFFPLCF